MLIHDKFHCEGNDNYIKFRNITERLTKQQSVEFALYCAKDIFHLIEDSYKGYAKLCFDLVDKWLIDENSVTSEDIRDAADAWNAANAASTAVTDWSAWSAWSASYAAWSASWFVETTDVAWSAANAADYATRAYAKYNKLNEYLVIANSYLTKTNINCPNYEIEGKILYLIDELEENIIVHKDKYYVNMNRIENCPEYGFDTQQKLLEELLYSEDRFWEFARNWLDNLYKNQQA